MLKCSAVAPQHAAAARLPAAAMSPPPLLLRVLPTTCFPWLQYSGLARAHGGIKRVPRSAHGQQALIAPPPERADRSR